MEQNDKDLGWALKYIKREFKHLKVALKLQAKEYKRRLDELNNENARILAAQEKSVSVEKFDGEIGKIYQQMENTIGVLRRDITDLKEFKQKQEGRGQGGRDLMDIIKLVIVIAGFFIAYFVIKK
jgi:chromosome segregation ATPase